MHAMDWCSHGGRQLHTLAACLSKCPLARSNLLVPPPLHLSLIVAGIVALLALSQVGNTPELLVVVHELVFGPDAVNNICQERKMYFTAGGQRDPHRDFTRHRNGTSPWDAHEDIDICLLLTSLHFLIMIVIITQVGTVVATFRCLNHRSRLHPFQQLCYASLLATLAFVTSECGDREVHGIVEEFGQNQSRVRQCCLFVRNRSLPRRLRVRSFIMVRWHFSARHNSTSTALLPGDACAGDSTQWRCRGH